MWVIVYVNHGFPDQTYIDFKDLDFYYYVECLIREAKQDIKDIQEKVVEIKRETINNKHLRWIIISDRDTIISIDAKYIE